MIKRIEKEFDECANLCDQKLEISNESYYLVDSNLKKINELISLFEKDGKTNSPTKGPKRNTLLDDSKTSVSNKSKEYIKLDPNNLKAKKDFLQKKTHRKTDKADEAIIPSNLNNFQLEDITFAEIDGKLDPNEPLFCFCNYVSYGNMVRCDNPNCPKQWFHFSCVGLNSLPKGKWFCSKDCASLKRSKK